MKNKTTQWLGNVISKARLTQILKTKKQCQQSCVSTICKHETLDCRKLHKQLSNLCLRSGNLKGHVYCVSMTTQLYPFVKFLASGPHYIRGWQGWKNYFFLSGNLGRRLEIFCKICNVTITKITKQMHNYCIICTLVIIGFRLVFVCLYIAIIVCYIPQL